MPVCEHDSASALTSICRSEERVGVLLKELCNHNRVIGQCNVKWSVSKTCSVCMGDETGVRYYCLCNGKEWCLRSVSGCFGCCVFRTLILIAFYIAGLFCKNIVS